ncbi:MAG: bifunctional 5,10-methylenetetrahydrofolate dehydrogenase/5,10-methenyltetrahydrofolate cyclohydrolase [Candidatus Berkelbacteria bacterium]|nr:bifunctional 5,10-methylenetetrahydrofolate dehydrogenase/5,10-methenyltetrahydrofolate cyclohydrolase [Candidatus Berkelbacteria bacterium]
MILEGRELASRIIKELGAAPPPRNCLAVIQVGNDPVSTLYVAKKKEIADELGVCLKLAKLPATATEDNILAEVLSLNDDSSVGGILVQMPLPQAADRNKIVSAIEPKKDPDGFHCLLKSEKFHCIPPTVLAIDEILDFYQIEKRNKNILVVGGGFLVGRPLFEFWKEKGFQVSILEKDASNYSEELKRAQIAVVSTGGGGRFSFQDFSAGAVVIDASTVSDDGKLRGDVEVEGWPDDRHLCPVPGGIGPVTVAMLFKNFYDLQNTLTT